MYTIKLTPAFERWFAGLKDNTTRLRLVRRLDKAQYGNLIDVKQIGPGWRMYFLQREQTLIVMFGDEDRSSKSADIKKAAALAVTIEE